MPRSRDESPGITQLLREGLLLDVKSILFVVAPMAALRAHIHRWRQGGEKERPTL
jgi:hypothetical protein